MSGLYLDAIKRRARQPLPGGIALEAFVMRGAEALGIVWINIAGGFTLWRDGAERGTFDTLQAMYAALDEQPVARSGLDARRETPAT